MPLVGRSTARIEGSSRGTESPEHKYFMRASALLSDVVFFFPAVIAFVVLIQMPKRPLQDQWMLIALHLLYPGYLLIDHGHFQYNAVSLGLCLLGVVAVERGKAGIGAIALVCALCFKQMELYHALPFFVALLRNAAAEPTLFSKLQRLTWIGICTLGTFGLIWFPFLSSVEDAVQVLHRIFPVARGIFEDKVANIWCSLSPIFKWKAVFSQTDMLRLSLFATLASVTPSLVMALLGRRTGLVFRLHLFTSALAFFLFSFQVHEKSILLVAMPALLLIKDYPLAAVWFLHISNIRYISKNTPLYLSDGENFPPWK